MILYNRRLDGLRAVAVLLVVLWHWLPQGRGVNWTPNGELGVDLFFVLSGYLITSILLDFRACVDEGKRSRRSAVGRFYVRRALRLFPLYYGVLLVLFFWPDVTGTTIRSGWPWYAAFLQNLWAYLLGGLDGILSHFWSLAVEEQFYLAWGLAVLVLPRRALAPVAAAGVGVAVVARLLGVVLVGGDTGLLGLWNFQTPCCLDSLALGALIALGVRGQSEVYSTLELWSRRLWPLCAAAIVVGPLMPRSAYVTGRFLAGVVAVRLVMWALDGMPTRSPISRLLEWRPVVGFGRRSYGLYVFHNLVPFFWRSVRSLWAVHIGEVPSFIEPLFRPPLALIAWSGLLVALAYSSWRFFEAPINRLKERFAP